MSKKKKEPDKYVCCYQLYDNKLKKLVPCNADAKYFFKTKKNCLCEEHKQFCDSTMVFEIK